MREEVRCLLFIMAIAALLCGCASGPNRTDVARLAVAKSNEEARRLYHISPFKPENGQMTTQGNHLVWDALTSSGGMDVVSKVVMDRYGMIVSVDVRLQISTANTPDLERESPPDESSKGPRAF